MAVPNTTTFTLQNVVDEVIPTTNDLADCFTNSDSNFFDPLYEGSKNSLLNFRNYNTEANTFIGGVGATSVTSAAALAAKTSLSESDIRHFAIDSNNNVSCYINVNYTINANAWSADSIITYYIDEKGRCTFIGASAFHNAFNPSVHKILVFPNATGCSSRIVGGGGAGTKNGLDVLCFPKLNPIGASGITNDNNFSWAVFYSDVYVHIDNATNDGGSPDVDISGAIASNISTFINYSANSNAPDEAVLETVGTTNSSITLEWTAVSHSNSIDHYLIFFDGIYFGKTSGTALDVTGLAPSTSYDFKVLTIDSEGNTSPFISVHTESTIA